MSKYYLGLFFWRLAPALALVLGVLPGGLVVSQCAGATIKWVGSSGDWSVATNWSGGTVPGMGDDAVIDTSNGDITVMISSGSNSVNSLVCQETLQLNGGTLAVSTSAQFGKNLMLSGGTIAGGTVETANGASLVVTSGGGTLDGVVVNGVLDVGSTTVSGTLLTVVDGLTLNGTLLVGNPTNNGWGIVSFAGSQVLGGSGTVVFGYHPWADSLWVANAGTTLVIGPGITVHGQNGGIGYNATWRNNYPGYGGAADAGVANQGTIMADVGGGTITIAGGSLNNSGTLTATNGGTLQLNSGTTMNSGTITQASGAVTLGGSWSNTGAIQSTGGTLTLNGSWSNTGTVQLSGGTVNLGGSLSVALVKTLQLGAGESVNLTGTLNNTNTTLVVDGAVAPWALAGGTIAGGTVETANGASLVVTSGGGTLDGVVVNGVLDVGSTTVSGTLLTVVDGLTLNGTLLVGNPTNNGWGIVSFAGSQVLGGSGTVVFGYHPWADSLWVANAGTTLVIGPGITVHGQNGGIGYNATWRNNYPGYGGAADAGVANQGTIMADVGGGTITIAGGSLNNSGTLTATNGGTLQLNSGTTMNSGTITQASGAVTLGGSWSNTGAIQSTGGTLTLNGSWSNTGTVQLSGGTVNLGGSLSVALVKTLQLGAGESVNLTGTLNNTNTTLVVDGAVAPWALAGGTIAGGTVETANGASLVVTSGGGTLDGVVVNGVLDVGSTTVSGTLLTVVDGLTLNGTLLVGNPTNNGWGIVSFAGSQVLGGSGTVVFGYHPWADSLWVANAGTTLVIGPGITVHGQNGGIGYNATWRNNYPGYGGAADAGVANQGTIMADVGGGTITIAGGSLNNSGTLTATNGGTLQLNSGTTMNSGTITQASGAVTLGGSWSNTGAIQSTGGTLTLNGSWSNTGTVQLSGGTVNLGGSLSVALVKTLQLGAGESVNLTGTLNNTNTTLVVDGAVAPWALAGGTIAGGTVETANGASLVVTSGGGTLDGVVVNGVLDVGSTTVSGTLLTVVDGLTLNGTLLVGNPTNNGWGIVSFAGSQVLGGSGTVVFGYHPWADSLWVANAGTTLVIGPGITVHGQNGGIGYNATWRNNYPGYGGAADAGVANQGTIMADVGGGTITIAGGSLNNSGTLTATNGGTLQLNSGTTMNSGTITVQTGVMTFANSFTQTVGTLDLGLNSPTDFGQIKFSGTATLGGTLAAHLNGGYFPNMGDAFAVLNYGANNPAFTNLSLPLSNVWQTDETNGVLILLAGAVLPHGVTVSPTNSVVAVGSTVTLQASVTGAGLFGFQWLRNGIEIMGATNATLVLANAGTNVSGAYTIAVSNGGGTLVSEAVQVQVLTPPGVVAAPQSQTASVGSAVDFTVSVSSDAPLAYQWRFNGANMAGATNASLSFNDVTRAQAGNYVVVVSNPVGVVTSTPPALLTVATGVACPGVPGGLVAWWRGEGDSSDYAGTNDAVFEGTVAYAPGEVGQAFSFDGTSSYLEVPNNPLWNLGTNDFSFELWANFSVTNSSIAVGDGSVVFLGHDEESGSRNKWLFGFGAGELYFYINGTGIGGHFLAQAPFNPNTNAWYHLGLTKAGGVYQFYVNGSQASSDTNNATIPMASAPLTIGQAQGLFMQGLLDEISIYNRALAPAEIQAIYQAGSQGKCSTTQPLTIGQAGFNANGKFQFQILGGQARADIQVQASADLTNWVDVWKAVLGTNPLLFIDPATTAGQQRYYRVVPSP